MKRWIGVDLDGTLAYGDGTQGPGVIGEPIKPMVDKVKQLLAEGKEVRIFTARVGETWLVKSSGIKDDNIHRLEQERAVWRWCQNHIGVRLPVTATKDFLMEVLYDDRARQVETNTGRVIGD